MSDESTLSLQLAEIQKKLEKAYWHRSALDYALALMPAIIERAGRLEALSAIEPEPIPQSVGEDDGIKIMLESVDSSDEANGNSLFDHLDCAENRARLITGAAFRALKEHCNITWKEPRV